MAGNADLIRALLPPPEVDLAHVVRDAEAFAAAVAAAGDPLDPELESAAVWLGGGRSYRGLEGFRRMWLDWLEPWASYHVRVEKLIDRGERVVALIRDVARRQDTDAEVEIKAGSIWTLQDRKVVRVEFRPRDEALEAAGLSE